MTLELLLAMCQHAATLTGDSLLEPSAEVAAGVIRGRPQQTGTLILRQVRGPHQGVVGWLPLLSEASPRLHLDTKHITTVET